VAFLGAATTLILAFLAPPSEAQQRHTNRYLQAGAPAIGQAWHGEEFLRAAKTLPSDPMQLPQFADPDGAAILERMTSTHNLDEARDGSRPLDPRLADLLKMMQGSMDIVKRYESFDRFRPAMFHAEMSRLRAYQLREAAVCLRLLTEFMAKVAHDDQYESRMQGLRLAWAGAIDLYRKTDLCLTSPLNGFTHDERRAVLTAMSETSPEFRLAFAGFDRMVFRAAAERDRALFPEAASQADIDHIERELAD
jgi:hypothetical protein